MDQFCLFVEELILAVILDVELFTEMVVPAAVASKYALDYDAALLDFLEAPLDLEHAPVFLNAKGCPLFLASMLFSFTKDNNYIDEIW